MNAGKHVLQEIASALVVYTGY